MVNVHVTSQVQRHSATPFSPRGTCTTQSPRFVHGHGDGQNAGLVTGQDATAVEKRGAVFKPNESKRAKANEWSLPGNGNE